MRLAIILHSTIILTIWSGFKIFLKNKTKSKPFSNFNSILVCQMKTKKKQEKLVQGPSMETGGLHRSEIPATQEDELGGSQVLRSFGATWWDLSHRPIRVHQSTLNSILAAQKRYNQQTRNIRDW